MDSDDDFSSSLKKYTGISFLIVSTLIILYYSYKNLRQRDSNSKEKISKKKETKKTFKQKMTIHITSMYNNNINSIYPIYELLDKLSNKYDIFLIIMIKDKKEENSIFDNLKPILEDYIVYKHRVLFCSSIDGVCSIVRSIDPLVHIEDNNYVIVNLIRYINEFWFVSDDYNNEKQNILNKINQDSNNKKLSIDELFNKVKFFSDYNSFNL